VLQLSILFAINSDNFAHMLGGQHFLRQNFLDYINNNFMLSLLKWE